MYQAGWAAAMAELNSKNRTSSARSWTWPAIALTFATTTAACLVAMVLPDSNVSNTDIDTVSVAVIEPVEDKQETIEVETQVQVETQSPARIASNNRTTQEASPETFGVASLFGFSIRSMVTARNLRNNRMLSAASAPLQTVSYESPIDDGDEPVQPLTPGALQSMMIRGGTL